MIINANELYNSALTVNVSLNNKIFKIDLTRKEQVLELLKSFDVNARADGKNKNTINVYNYKTKTPVKYEYKRSIKIYDVLTKSGFIYAKTGSACYTDVSKNNYVATAKNIFTHHLNLSETEIYTKMKEFSIDNILFMSAINNLRFDELYILYMFKNYNENDLKKLFLDMNYDIFFYEETKKSFDSLHVGYVLESLYGTNLETFVAMRSKLVSRYLNYSATLTIDNVLYGYGHPLPPTSQIPETPETPKTSFISVKLNDEYFVFDMFKRHDLINFLLLYDDGTLSSIFDINTISIYNYKTKKPTTFTYKKGMSFEEVLKKAGFENANTGAACYTKINDTNYIVNAKNIYAHHLNMGEKDVFHKMNEISVSDVMFLNGMNFFGESKISSVYILYIYKNYELAEAENKLRQLNCRENFIILMNEQYKHSLNNINFAQLHVEQQIQFEQMRNQLVTMYVAQAVSLMVDRVMYGPGYVPEVQPPKVENPPVVGDARITKEVEIINSKGQALGEFDEIDLNKKIFYEDKTATGLDKVNPKTGQPAQTIEQFADKPIFQKTKIRINNLLSATGTREAKTNSLNVPTIEELKNIKEFKFRLDGDSTELIKAVENSLEKLRIEFNEYTFSAEFVKGEK